jgi:hypothetical protein
VERHCAAAASKPERFADDLVRLRDVDQYQPGSHHVERLGRQAGASAIRLDHLDISQASLVHIAACLSDGVVVRFDADHTAVGADALRQQVEAATGTATDLCDACARRDADLVEQHPGVLDAEFGLLLQAPLLRCSMPEEIGVDFHRRVSFRSGCID